jgi:hypothetical protein
MIIDYGDLSHVAYTPNSPGDMWALESGSCLVEVMTRVIGQTRVWVKVIAFSCQESGALGL